ncbi:hypothetical protein PCC7424_3902 [Gloeothece citriformis PCC 7424]|uniref:Uncharacterized protein n=1 Tax=Gloeothece citriformis (strain PCC 7424) TaxID=65393 RepID=B7KKE7_GLOC7|nr:hypothetical protein [Gloeothece citriformis]ACK72280.1 hypothetical protein PCC7424_3902 [Gloeothece citriformis PCC 7424]
MLISPPPTQPKKQLKTSPIGKLKTAMLPLGLIGFGMLNGAAGNPVLVIVGVVTGSVALVQPYLKGERANRHIKRAFLLTLGTLVFTFLNLIARPARAQFFQNAEEFFNTTFTSSGAAIPLVFNTLRALYIVYLAVAFIGVFNSVRQDEDWVAAARTPILVVITVTLADILTGLITG